MTGAGAIGTTGTTAAAAIGRMANDAAANMLWAAAAAAWDAAAGCGNRG